MKRILSLLVLAFATAAGLRADEPADPGKLDPALVVGSVILVRYAEGSYEDTAGRTYYSGASTPGQADAEVAVATPRVAPAPAAPAVWTALTFFERFTETEQLAIFADDSAEVRLFRAKLLAALEVRGDDPRTVAGLDLLVSRGLLTSERKTAILTP